MADRKGPMTSHTYDTVGVDVIHYAVELTGTEMLVRLMFSDQNLEHVTIKCKMMDIVSEKSDRLGMFPSGRYPGAMLVTLPAPMTAILIDGYKLRLSQTRDI